MKDSIIRELAIKYILKSKVFYLIMSITIIVTTMFVTAILSFGDILTDTYTNMAKGDNGNYEISVNNIEYDMTQKIIKELNISNHSTTSEIKRIMVDDKKGQSISIDSDYLDINELKIINGNYPKGNMEIAIEEDFLKKYNYSLGQTIRVNDTDEMKIVGIMSDFKFGDKKNGHRFYFENSLDSGILTNLYIKSEKTEIKNYIDSIKKYVNVEKILINDNIVNSESSSFTSMAIILTVLLLAATFFSINNLYAINFKKRLSNIGMLITVGTTDKQVSKLFNYEVFIFSTIPILIGIALGNLLTYLIIKIGASDISLKYFLSVKVLITVYLLLSPTKEEIKKDGALNYYKNNIEIVLKFLRKCFDLGIKTGCDCNKIPICTFTNDQLREMVIYDPISLIQKKCTPVLDVMPNLEVIRCFATSDTIRVDLKKFNNLHEMMGYFLKSIDSKILINEECSSCKLFERKICLGGCLAFA